MKVFRELWCENNVVSFLKQLNFFQPFLSIHFILEQLTLK